MLDTKIHGGNYGNQERTVGLFYESYFGAQVAQGLDDKLYCIHNGCR